MKTSKTKAAKASRPTGRVSKVDKGQQQKKAYRVVAFVDAYFARNMNATRAYMDSHGSHVTHGTAAVEGCKLLKDPQVRAEIDRRMDEHWREKQIDADKALARLAQLATLDLTQCYDETTGKMLPVHRWPADVRSCMIGMKASPGGRVEYRFENRAPALRTVLEVSGRLRTTAASIDELAAAMRADMLAHTGKVPGEE